MDNRILLPFKKVRIPKTKIPYYYNILEKYSLHNYDSHSIPFVVNLRQLIQISNDNFSNEMTLKLLALYEKSAPKEIQESKIQSDVVKYAKGNGFKVYRITTPDAPDRMFIAPKGTVFFIEFKRPGKKPTKRQELEHEELRKFYKKVYVVDNTEWGKKVIDVFS